MQEKIFISGATGLLGSHVSHLFQSHGYDILKSANHAENDIIKINFENSIFATEKIQAFSWDVLIHCAAIKDPDACENNINYSQKINVETPISFAKMTKKLNRRFIFISTDYVFDGKNPPYHENDKVNPLNVYGQQKAMAEEGILKENPNAIILRVPYLYGNFPSIKQCPMVMQSLNMIQNQNTHFKLNAEAIRYPTWTGDIALALEFLINNKNAFGIYHFSAQESFNRIQIHELILSFLEKSTPNVEYIFESAPLQCATRPINSHLSIDRLCALGFTPPVSSFISQLNSILTPIKEISL